MSWLAAIIKAVLDALLGFGGDRLDRNKADNTLRETGAREAEARQHERFENAAREAMDLRRRPAGADGELDDGLRAPADRAARRAD